jgi:outer membrane protein OmpA-like peptidoglycan-associated protein
MPGLQITFPIRKGVDTRRKQLGDYDFLVTILEAGNDGYKFKWEATSPARRAAGFRTVTPQDQKSAHHISLFYQTGQDYTVLGCTNIVRVSDDLYGALKSGVTVPFALDGPETPLSPNGVRSRDDLPRNISRADEEQVFIWLNDKRVPVRAIKAVTDVGWTYWILDNPQFPVMLAGAGPFYWQEPRFSTSIIDAKKKAESDRQRKADKEANRVAKDLADKGIATSHAILFAFDSDALTSQSKLILRSIATYLEANPTMNVLIEGHTDNKGGMAYNVNLSTRRAEAVKQFLVTEGGIAPERLSSAGRSYKMPVASNKTEAGRARNRRVVFKRL